MPEDNIQAAVRNMFQDLEYGFEAYVRLKNDQQLRRMRLYEGRGRQDGNFKLSVQKLIADALCEKFLQNDAQFVAGERIADNQNVFYIIEQSEEYSPFILPKRNSNEKIFRASEIKDAQGLLFRFERSSCEALWAYQHLYVQSVPNKGRKSLLSTQEQDVFVEMKNPLLSISRRVDLLIWDNKIISDRLGLLQRNFGLQKFIMSSAREAIGSIEKLNVLKNPEKLTDYIERGQLRYAKKMMCLKDSSVLKQLKERPKQLLKRIDRLPRWHGKFMIEDGKIVLKTFAQVEELIELLDETYTRSDVTGQEYVTDVKRPVEAG